VNNQTILDIFFTISEEIQFKVLVMQRIEHTEIFES